MNTVYSGVPFEHPKSSVNMMWSNTSSPKFTQTKGDDASKPGKAGGVDGNLNVHHKNELPTTMRPVTAISDGSYELLPLKGTTVKFLGGGDNLLSIIFSYSISWYLCQRKCTVVLVYVASVIRFLVAQYLFCLH